MKATHDDTTFTLTGRYWTGTFPIEDLPKQLAFYRGQRDKFPKAKGTYDATIEALEKLAEEIGLNSACAEKFGAGDR
ncbi:hypothetical protein Q0601_14910 [Paracoccus onubensis]|uniref:hypothetical protein n=1 Tax=Paracoccus onubensis TaxID=1675788 RepID=UPI00272EFE8E|nr:hypothetical protein [Paracoccus onubensis]MDP0928474.1 hypothetical protein [Paracoccus onubensis]